jgi:hypothetical protein
MKIRDRIVELIARALPDGRLQLIDVTRERISEPTCKAQP